MSDSSPRSTDTERTLLWLTAKAVESNDWIPHCPTLKQLRFLAAPQREKLYGGAAGGGKSDALLMDALLYVDEPGYSAILFRKTYADLALPGALMDRAHEWLGPTAAKWNEQTKTWTFPSSATLTFGYLEHENDKYRYQGSEFQYIGFDELTQFAETQYRYLRSRLRRGSAMRVPLRMGAASNPGGVGHDWVYSLFVDKRRANSSEAVFIPARLDENPHLDQEEYRKALEGLDEITRAQLLEGMWVKDESATVYKRGDLPRFDLTDAQLMASGAAVGRYVFFDTAYEAESGEARRKGSDYTAWAVFDLAPDYRIRLIECRMERLDYPDLLAKISELALAYNHDGRLRDVVIERAASGKSAIQSLSLASESWLSRYVRGFDPGTKSKVLRAKSASLWTRRRCVEIPRPGDAEWVEPFTEELFSFPAVEHDDRTDAFTMGVLWLENMLAEGLSLREGVA